MSNYTTIQNNLRQWTSEAIQLIQDISNEIHKGEDESLIFFVLSHVLGSSLEESCYIKTYEEKYDHIWDNKNQKSDQWSCPVRLWYDEKSRKIKLSINDIEHEVRDLYPLWGILRKHFQHQ